MLKYYYIDDVSQLQCGPFLPNELQRKNISPQTMVWRSGMQDWAEAGTMPELAYLFDDKALPNEQRKEEISHPANSLDKTQRQESGNRNRNTNKSDDRPPMPKTWMIECVIFTFICCSPVSLMGLFFAARTESLYSDRKYEAAEKSSNRAKMWGLGGILFWPTLYVIYSLTGIGRYYIDKLF